MYLSANDIASLEGEEKTHFLNPGAVRVNKSLGDIVGMKNLGVHMIHVAPGKYSTEFHVHYFEEECLYVIAGRGVARIGAGTQHVGPGDFIGCPLNGVAHDLYNDGSEDLVCLVVGQRLICDIADYPDKKKRLYRHGGRQDLVDLGAVNKLA